VAVISGRGRIAPRASAALTAAPHREPSPAPCVRTVIEVRAPRVTVARARTAIVVADRDATIAGRGATIIVTTAATIDATTAATTVATTARRR
jgi:hypothetical protein